MSGETVITVIGNLTADPELRFTPSGSAVANFTLASTPRVYKNGEWEDGETLFLRAAIWREAAENVAATLAKGMRVIVTGKLKSRNYETKEGEKRTVIELEVDEIGPSLKYAQAKVQRTQNTGGQQGNGNNYDAARGGRQQGQGGYQQGGQQGGGFGGAQQGQGGFGGPQQGAQGGGFGGGQQQGGFGGQQGHQQPPAGQQQPQTGPNSQWGTGVDPRQAGPAEDPWATPGVSNAGGWGTGNADGEPPF